MKCHICGSDATFTCESCKQAGCKNHYRNWWWGSTRFIQCSQCAERTKSALEAKKQREAEQRERSRIERERREQEAERREQDAEHRRQKQQEEQGRRRREAARQAHELQKRRRRKTLMTLISVLLPLLLIIIFAIGYFRFHEKAAQVAFDAEQWEDALAHLAILDNISALTNNANPRLDYAKMKIAIEAEDWDIAAQEINSLARRSYKDTRTIIWDYPELRQSLVSYNYFPPSGHWRGDIRVCANDIVIRPPHGTNICFTQKFIVEIELKDCYLSTDCGYVTYMNDDGEKLCVSSLTFSSSGYGDYSFTEILVSDIIGKCSIDRNATLDLHPQNTNRVEFSFTHGGDREYVYLTEK